MTLTLLAALQHGWLDMLFQCCFCGWNPFNWTALRCKQELVTLIHRNGHVQKKVGLCDITKIKKSQIFVLFENEPSYEDFFCPQVF